MHTSANVAAEQLLNLNLPARKNKTGCALWVGTIAFLVVVYIVWSPLSLVKIGGRSNPYYLDRGLKAEIQEETAGMSAKEICEYSIRKTARLLSFSVKNDLARYEANCVGYAQMCATISNAAFRSNGLSSNASPVVGYVMFYGVNLCNVLKWFMPSKRWENFVKDHDFVEFHIDGRTIYADASAYDLLWKDCKTVAE